MKALKIALALILGTGLIIGTALPGLADPDEPANTDDIAPGMVRGSVTSLGEGSFVIQSGEEKLTITVNEETRYFKAAIPRGLAAAARQQVELRCRNQEEAGASTRCRMNLRQQDRERIRNLARQRVDWCQNQEGTGAMAPAMPARLKARGRVFQSENGDIPGPRRANLKWLHPFGEEVTFDDITVGDRVAVWLADGDTLLAKRVLIIEPATCARLRGTISDVSPADIIIEPADGSEAVTLEYNRRTMFILRGTTQVEPGQSVCAVYDSDSMVARRVTAGMPPLKLTE